MSEVEETCEECVDLALLKEKGEAERYRFVMEGTFISKPDDKDKIFEDLFDRFHCGGASLSLDEENDLEYAVFIVEYDLYNKPKTKYFMAVREWRSEADRIAEEIKTILPFIAGPHYQVEVVERKLFSIESTAEEIQVEV